MNLSKNQEIKNSIIALTALLLTVIAIFLASKTANLKSPNTQISDETQQEIINLKSRSHDPTTINKPTSQIKPEQISK